MKRICLVFSVALGMVACNDNMNGSGSSIDSSGVSPNIDNSSDNTHNTMPDSTMMDSTKRGNIDGSDTSASGRKHPGVNETK